MIFYDLTIRKFMRACQSCSRPRRSSPSSCVSASARCRFAPCCLSTVNKSRNSVRVVLAKKLLRCHHDTTRLVSFLWSTSQTMTSDFVAISALCGCWICLTTEPFCDLNTWRCSHNHTTNQHHKVALDGRHIRLVWEVLRRIVLGDVRKIELMSLWRRTLRYCTC